MPTCSASGNGSGAANTPKEFTEHLKMSNTITKNESESLALPGREAEESMVRELHTEWLDLRRKSLRVVIQLGGILTRLKAELKNATPKRNWESYTRNHLKIEPRTARNYMRLYRQASEIDTLGKFLKSETVSEIGIREALDFLAELAKAAKAESNASKSTSGSRKMQSEADKQHSLMLADGSLIDLNRSHWADGLVSLHMVESWMNRANSSSNDQGSMKLEARRQRAVVRIAAEINRVCGKAQPDAAAELAKSSLEVIRTLLSDLTKQ